MPAGSFYNFVTDRKQPMIFYVDSPWCPDPGYSLTLYFDSKSYVNYSNYANADVDKLLAETAATADDKRPARQDQGSPEDHHGRGALDLRRLSELHDGA